MYEELRNKRVKMIVGTNSGISVYGAPSIATSTLTVFGIVLDFDNELIKISEGQISGAIPGGFGVLGGYKSSVESFGSMYVNKNNIVTISVLGE